MDDGGNNGEDKEEMCGGGGGLPNNINKMINSSINAAHDKLRNRRVSFGDFSVKKQVKMQVQKAKEMEKWYDTNDAADEDDEDGTKTSVDQNDDIRRRFSCPEERQKKEELLLQEVFKSLNILKK